MAFDVDGDHDVGYLYSMSESDAGSNVYRVSLNVTIAGIYELGPFKV